MDCHFERTLNKCEYISAVLHHTLFRVVMLNQRFPYPFGKESGHRSHWSHPCGGACTHEDLHGDRFPALRQNRLVSSGKRGSLNDVILYNLSQHGNGSVYKNRHTVMVGSMVGAYPEIGFPERSIEVMKPCIVGFPAVGSRLKHQLIPKLSSNRPSGHAFIHNSHAM